MTASRILVTGCRVVGPVFTDGVAAYNAGYERARDHLAAVLRRPDQAITWAPRPGRA